MPLPVGVIGACAAAAVAGETRRASLRRPLRAAVSWAFPLALMAAGYLAMRTGVLGGGVMKPNNDVAAIDIEQGDAVAAERRLREVRRSSMDRMGPAAGTLLMVQLSVTLDRQGRTAEAAEALREAMAAFPRQAASLGDKLAVCLYKQGRKEEAQHVLEAAVQASLAEPGAGTATALFRLGMLYAEQGRNAEARQLLERFLAATRTQTQRAMTPLREQATTALKGLGAGGK